MHYDLLVVGSGLFGAVIAHEAIGRDKKVLVLEKRDHIGGNCYTESVDGINIHVYGAHIFRTADRRIWDYMSQFCEFNHFVNSPVANYRGELYNLPFNMNTFHELWGVVTPDEAREAIEEAYKASLVARRYVPVTADNLFDKLAAYQPLDSDEYRALEDAVVRDFRRDLDHLDDLLKGTEE